MKRVFLTKAFARWCTLSEGFLCAAAREIEDGFFETDLGKGLVKKRIAYPGRGKSGSARLLVAHQLRDCLIFLVGRDKSDPGSDFTRAQVEAAKELASGFGALRAGQMWLAIEDGALKEICRGKDSAIQP